MEKYLKIVIIAVCILALSAFVYSKYSSVKQEKTRLEEDQARIMKMLEEQKQKR